MSGQHQFQKKNRLTKPQEFKKAFSSSKKISGGGFLVTATSNGLDYARLGLAISRRHFKTAVARNKIKRIIRENFRNYKEGLRGYDIVVTTRKPLSKIDQIVISRIMIGHWKKVIK